MNMKTLFGLMILGMGFAAHGMEKKNTANTAVTPEGLYRHIGYATIALVKTIDAEEEEYIFFERTLLLTFAAYCQNKSFDLSHACCIVDKGTASERRYSFNAALAALKAMELSPCEDAQSRDLRSARAARIEQLVTAYEKGDVLSLQRRLPSLLDEFRIADWLRYVSENDYQKGYDEGKLCEAIDGSLNSASVADEQFTEFLDEVEQVSSETPLDTSIMSKVTMPGVHGVESSFSTSIEAWLQKRWRLADAGADRTKARILKIARVLKINEEKFQDGIPALSQLPSMHGHHHHGARCSESCSHDVKKGTPADESRKSRSDLSSKLQDTQQPHVTDAKKRPVWKKIVTSKFFMAGSAFCALALGGFAWYTWGRKAQPAAGKK